MLTLKKILENPTKILKTNRTSIGIAIQGTTLRIVVAKGRHINDWAIVPFNPTLLKAGFISDPDAMASVIKNKIPQAGNGTMRVSAALGGTQSIVRLLNLPKISHINMDDIVIRESRRLLAFNVDTQYIYWRRLSQDEKFQQILVILIPKEGLKALVDSLIIAKLRPSLVELAPMALLHGFVHPTGVLANLETNNLDIIIIRNSLPVQVRSMWLGDEPMTVDSASTKLAEELNSTVSSYNSNNPDRLFPDDAPVIFTGGLPEEDFASQTAELVGRRVIPMVQDIEAPLDFPFGAMAVPVGLILASR